jgi:hypothetical protein
MKNFLIEQIVTMLSNKVTNLKTLASHLYEFNYKELNNLADLLVSDDERDHTRAEKMITSRIAMDVLRIA